MRVPFNDLYKHHSGLLDEISAVIRRVIEESSFIRGDEVSKFEEDFASLIGVANCVSCANGTDALYIAMKSLDVQWDDEIIVPAHSWISTSETVTQAGGKVVFCDTLPGKFTMDPGHLKKLISAKTVGVIPVHLYGQSADVESIMSIANDNGLWVIEDCAQAHLAEFKGQQVGTFGNAATFSFYPGKNLGAMGDAGAIVCNDNDLALKMASYARHGGLTKGSHVIEGINSRMDGIQAAILNIKLPHLRFWTDARQRHAAQYLALLADVEDLTLPVVDDEYSHVWHLFVVQHPRRDELATFLKEKGIDTVVNYPISLPFLPAYARLEHEPDDFPVAYHCQSKILSLPLFPEMTRDQLIYVADCVKEFCA